MLALRADAHLSPHGGPWGSCDLSGMVLVPSDSL